MERFQKSNFSEAMKASSDPVVAIEMFRNVLITLNEQMKALKICPEYDGKRTEIFIPSKEVSDGIPVYVYEPRSKPPDATIMVYFHGGGNVVGSRDQVDYTCKMLSSNAQCIVVNVEYRLAPEHKFPAMMNDGETVTRWVLANRTTIGGTKKSKVGVSGDSCGGQIAASVAHVVPGLKFQILIYPLLNGSLRESPSRNEFREKDLDTFMTCIEQVVVEKKDDLNDPRYAIIQNKKFDHLPPTLFIVAELDALRDDSYDYAKKLTDAKVENEVFLSKGAIHGFYTQPGYFVELCRESYSKTVEFIKKVT